MRREWVIAVGAVVMLAVGWPAQAQTTGAATTAEATQSQANDDPDRDLQVVLGEPDFTLGVLPTTLRLQRGKMAFRITHRFTYQINGGSVGEFFENGFGFDSSATTGFELRFGLAPGTQVVVHRTGSRNVQFLAQHQLRAQRSGGPVSFDVLAAIEGQNNFREEHSFVVGGVMSHRFGDQGAVYLEPIGVFNATPELPASDRNTFVLGVGARVRLGKSRVYVVAEAAPRLAGYDGGTSVMTFGLEKRVGGHLFQINVSNAFGTTLTQVGHGGPRLAGDKQHWHLGFNMTRKFW
jgi:Membrane bound beta barrel domain (DUF5777)